MKFELIVVKYHFSIKFMKTLEYNMEKFFTKSMFTSALLIAAVFPNQSAANEKIVCTKNVSEICNAESIDGVSFPLTRDLEDYSAGGGAFYRSMVGKNAKGMCIARGRIYAIAPGVPVRNRGSAKKSKSIRKACNDLAL